MNAALTISGATVSCAVLVLNLKHWWQGTRELKALVPYGGGLVTGTSWTLCIGGTFGWVAVEAVDLGNRAGQKAVHATTGTNGGGALAHGSAGTLSYPGACAVLVAAVVGGAVWKAAGKTDKKRILGGMFSGLTLCATAGAAQLMQWVPELYNTVGAGAVTLLNGGLSL